MNTHTIPRNFVMAPLQGAIKQGVDIHKLLATAGISDDVLSEPNYRVSAAQYAVLLRSLWVTLDDEYMGLAPVKGAMGSFSMMCRAVIHCNNLEHVLRRASEFYGLFHGGSTHEIRFEENNVLLVFKLALECDPDRFLHESMLVIWHRFSSWLVDRRIPLKEVRLGYSAPEHENQYWPLFACPIIFDAEETALVFDRQFLELPIMQTEPVLKEFLKVSPADLLARPEDRNTMTAHIRHLLGRDFTQDFPDFDWLAEQVHLAPQSLRRKLREEGTNFQEIKDGLRRDTAIGLLNKHELSIQDIAEQMGFSEASTFHRAFKKWTGLTPGDYRKNKDR
ncbi:AraC family transcriptional regulator [Litoribacillus peritrichatus]|uniref:AraC family transcriptional regulator n=1 Tax=Litoribacillus peritrichatus TaxID=718191 RepID=A0ABP7M4Y7_9GAMM